MHCLHPQGRGSTWQEGLTLSASGTPLVGGKSSAAAAGASGAGGAGAGGGNGGGGARGKGGERLMVLSGLMEPPEVARVFEERLAEALLGGWDDEWTVKACVHTCLHILHGTLFILCGHFSRF
jgi:hypothetical protein